MPQNAFFLWTHDLLVSQKTMQRHFFSTLHPLSSVIFATATVLAFLLLRNSRLNFHCYTEREATPTQKSAQKRAATSRDFLRERLQSAFTLANQLHWIAQSEGYLHTPSFFGYRKVIFIHFCLFCYRKVTFIQFCLFCFRKVFFIHFGLFCYWVVQAGLSPLTFIWHRLSPLDVLTSSAYFLHNGRRWQWILKVTAPTLQAFLKAFFPQPARKPGKDTFHPSSPFPVALVNTTAVALVLLCTSMFNCHCYAQRLLRNQPGMWQLQSFVTSGVEDYNGHSLM